MVNTCESPINPVTIAEPKLLGSNQKVYGRMIRCFVGSRRRTAIGEEAGPKPVVWQLGNVVSPYLRQQQFAGR